MNKKGYWQLVLQESIDEKTRLIFSSCFAGHLIDVTVKSEAIEKIASEVLTNQCTCEQLISFLNYHSVSA
ncbi:MAG: hypothetical protein H6Q71_21 [Firmicutes bacterium]|nr:hypothetical protein [Bacillota bacterium]